MTPKENGLPVILINDGRLMEQNLNSRGYDHQWLEKQLRTHGAKELREVYLLTVDERGQVYFAPKEETK